MTPAPPASGAPCAVNEHAQRPPTADWAGFFCLYAPAALAGHASAGGRRSRRHRAAVDMAWQRELCICVRPHVPPRTGAGRGPAAAAQPAGAA